MNQKPDGRLYSRVLRHCVFIAQYVGFNRNFTFTEVAQELHDNDSPEFFITRLNRTIRTERIKDYFRFMSAINTFERRIDNYKLAFPLKTTDREWAIKFSDLAWSYLAIKTGCETNLQFQSTLHEKILQLHRENHLPMLIDLIDDFELVGNHNEEFFRWAMYLYTDGENCPFDIRHFPMVIDNSGNLR